jgi:NADPH2:quinone reductase
MQVIEFKEFGSPSQLGLAERPLPQADANTAVVRIEAAAVNPQRLENMQDAYRRQLCLAYQGGIVPAWWWTAEAVDRPGGVGFGR